MLDQPLAERARPELGTGLRHWPVDGYLILYRVAADGIEIVRIVHGRRNLGGQSLAADSN